MGGVQRRSPPLRFTAFGDLGQQFKQTGSALRGGVTQSYHLIGASDRTTDLDIVLQQISNLIDDYGTIGLGV
jgi:hypothetical protein